MQAAESNLSFVEQSYETALAMYPSARRDADWLFAQMDIQCDDSILEVVAGTGWLTGQIAQMNSAGILYVHDRAPRRLRINESMWGHLDHLQFTTDLSTIFNGACKKAISLGGWHLVQNQVEAIRTVLGKLQAGGCFCLGDFADNSSIQEYLDEVVDKIVPEGSRALFASESRMINLGRLARASCTRTVSMEVPFTFESKKAIGIFFQKAMGLDLHPLEILEDIHRYFVIERVDNTWSVLIPYVYAVFHK